jgi:tetratricopeptide (TPR) repeat protein
MQYLIQFLFFLAVISSFCPARALTDSEVAYIHAKRLFDKQHPRESIPFFDRAIELDSKNVNARYYRARALLDTEERTKALADVNVVLKQLNSCGPAYALRSQVYFETGKLGSAMDDMSNAVRYSKNAREKAHRLYMRGKYYRICREFDKALADFTESIALDPKFDGDYYQRGQVYFELGRYQKAVTDFTSAIKRVKPENVDMQVYLSSRMNAYEKAGRHDLAAQDKKKVDSQVKDTFGSFFKENK